MNNHTPQNSPTPPPERRNKRWYSAEVSRLLFLRGEGKNPKAIAEQLGRTETAVRVKLSKLGGLSLAW